MNEQKIETQLDDMTRILMRRIFTLEKTLAKYRPSEWEQWNFGDKLSVTQPDSIHKGETGELLNFKYSLDGQVLAQVQLPAGTFFYPPAFLERVEEVQQQPKAQQPVLAPEAPEAPPELSIEAIARSLAPIVSMAKNSSNAAKASLNKLCTKHSEIRVREAISSLPVESQSALSLLLS